MAPTTYLQARLGELLTAALAGLTLARTGNPIPSRSGHTHGPPVPDFCTDDGLLAVYLDNPAVSDDNPSQRITENSGPVMRMPVVRLCIDLYRCVPTLDGQGVPPSAAALTTSADGLANDMWALDTYLRVNQASLFPTGLGTEVIPNFSDPVPLNPLGGVGGWRWKIQVPVSDAGP